MYEIFEKLLTLNDVTAYRVAKETGISTATLTQWKKGTSTPKPDKLRKIADFFGVSLDYLLTGEEITKEWIEKQTSIPVLGRIQAGIPVEAIEDIIDYEELTVDMAKTGEYFALKIKGDSMEPKFSEGDVVIVRKQEDVESGDIGVVIVNGNDATIKKVVKHEEGGLSLIASNPMYTPRFYTNNEIESLPVTVLGKVVELRAKF